MARKIGSRYTAYQILGRGSAGTVWLGEGPDGAVAIKLLRDDLSADQELVGRFVQERAALVSLDHPHVVGIRDLVVDGNDLALVMDLVRGVNLRSRLDRERRLPPGEAVAITADIADALAAAHAAGYVHRDVKPENILLDESTGAALLSDFGVAKLIDEPSRAGGRRVVGTPDYVAPEIVEGLPPRAAVDIYALATVLYELLAGFTPFGGGHPGAVLRRHVTEAVAPLPGIPDELWRLLHQCLAKGPASRLRAGEVASRLRELLPPLAGLPVLDIDEPDAEPAPAPAPTGYEDHQEPLPTRSAVPLVQGATAADPESANRDTHTSMRVPGPQELAGGALGTARTPRAPGLPRAGSARHRAAERRRRLKLAAVATVAAATLGVGGWLVLGGDDGDSSKPAVDQSTP
ncbi:serine/threonine protein kinase [Streptomyces sp. XM4193]|uniref:serine/threonine-protein kinase n=1 Tax=Streptomyces sp. XM4193 TaxID=2929782 RepID=UPI001FFB46BD|nr:serine/threonine-protein kinase [Streptomyces sp. XM4193]MCK1798443.1 serine/threonine protein kinase [Streptomyces sp. XM4193]